LEDSGTLLLNLVLLLILAKILEAPLRKYHLHPIPGHVVAGIILGPYVLGIVYPSPELLGVSYFGLLLLMFYTGLTTDFRELKRRGKSIILMGGMGVLATFTLIYYFLGFFGITGIPALFLAAALSNTATETVAATIAQKGDPKSSSLLIGASFVDDLMAVFMIGIMSGISAGFIDYFSLGVLFFKTMSFLAVVFIVSEILVSRYTKFYKLMSQNYFWFASYAIMLALSLSLISRMVGLSELIGSYLAGILVSRGREFHDPFLRTRIAISEFISDFTVILDVIFIPLFFTYIGISFQPGAVNLSLYAVLLTLVMLGKIIGAAPIAYRDLKDVRRAFAVGTAMGGRGALDTALLKIGLDRGIISSILFNTAITVSLTTTIIAPILYILIYRKEQ